MDVTSLSNRPDGYKVKYLEDVTMLSKGIVIVCSKGDAIGYISYYDGAWMLYKDIDQEAAELSDCSFDELTTHINTQYEEVTYQFINFK